MAALIILVHSEPRLLRHTEALLSREGCLVAALSSLDEARHLLDSVMPDLLIGHVEPGSYESIQLGVRNYHYNAQVPVIVTSSRPDPLVEEEAKRYGTPHIVAPLENPAFLVAVHAAIARRRLAQRPVRRWPRRPVTAVVELEAADTRAKVVDVSYGGLRLAFRDAGAIPETFEITLPTDHSTITVNRVWTADSPDDGFVSCGAVLTEAEADSWRAFVNSVDNSAAR